MLPTACPKPRPRLLEQREAKATVTTTDRKERATCHRRSGGRCEVIVGRTRCPRRVAENHHLIGGIGRRNRGRSILAAHRLDTCATCHSELTGNVLVPVDGTQREAAATVRYQRVR